jgi:D-alanyl-D-alanine endopeptidase (penicillin-binding protein 7)
MKIILSLWLIILPLVCNALPITAKSWLVADSDGNVIQSKNINEIRSIASITKLMTVMVVLDANQDLDQRLTQHTRRDLINLALIKSDNAAANTLCEKYPGGYNKCIDAMNKKTQVLGMSQTKFKDATGLSVFNISTARDLITLVLTAKNYMEIVAASNTGKIKIKNQKKSITVNNTNPIVNRRHDFIVSKTGWTNDS